MGSVLTYPNGTELSHHETVTLPVAVCRDTIRAKLAEAIAEIRGDYRSEIALKPLAP